MLHQVYSHQFRKVTLRFLSGSWPSYLKNGFRRFVPHIIPNNTQFPTP